MSQKKSSESILEVHFHGIADKGQCVGKSLTGETVFAVGPVPGDKALIKVFRKRKGFYKGQVMSYLSLSASRVEPVCSHFAQCGGCKWQHLNYDTQLEQKEIASLTIPDLSIPIMEEYVNEVMTAFDFQTQINLTSLEKKFFHNKKLLNFKKSIDSRNINE